MKLNESGMAKCLRANAEAKTKKTNKEMFAIAERAAHRQLKERGYVLVNYSDSLDPINGSFRLEQSDFSDC